jgi:hypothetical protein
MSSNLHHRQNLLESSLIVATLHHLAAQDGAHLRKNVMAVRCSV